MPTRRIMGVSLATAVLGFLSIEFLGKLWASYQAARGNHPAVAGAILGGL
jgi:hypothetical protein